MGQAQAEEISGNMLCKQYILVMQQHNTGNFPSVDGWKGGDSENTVPPTVSKDQINKHLRNLNIHKSKGPNKIHPGVLKKLADVVPSLSQ